MFCLHHNYVILAKIIQRKYNSIFLVVDMHAITTNQKPSELRKRCISFAAQYISCGINPKNAAPNNVPVAKLTHLGISPF